MGRLSQEESEKRQAYALEVFQQQPTLSVNKANALMKKRFHGVMNSAKLYALRSQVQKAAPAVPSAPAVVALVPGTNGQPKRRGRPPRASLPLPQAPATTKVVTDLGTAPGLPTIVHLANLGAGEAITATLDLLRRAGLTELSVTAATPRYVIIDRP